MSLLSYSSILLLSLDVYMLFLFSLNSYKINILKLKKQTESNIQIKIKKCYVQVLNKLRKIQ